MIYEFCFSSVEAAVAFKTLFFHSVVNDVKRNPLL